MLKIDSILVPMDFSENSEHALDYAIDLAGKLGADIQLLHCYIVEMFSMVAYGADHMPSIPQDFAHQVERAAGSKLATYKEQVARSDIQVSCHLSTLVPSDGIVRTAQELGSDLIVMGTHGLTGLSHALMGSVAERTIRHAPCPVLTVRSRTPE